LRDYLSDLFKQVSDMVERGATLEEVRNRIDPKKCAVFRQFPPYRASFADNAASVYKQLKLAVR